MAKDMMDIELDDDDLKISDGDWVLAESTEEHQRQLLLNGKGDYKANPTICVSAERYIDGDNGYPALIQEITAEFSRDGMAVASVAQDSAGDVISEAEY